MVKKTDKSYYLCQVFGNLIFWGLILSISSVGSTEAISLTGLVFAFFKGFISTVVISHFIIRAYLKSNVIADRSKVKFFHYISLIFAAACLATIAQMLISPILIDLLAIPQREKTIPLQEYGLLGEFVFGLQVNAVIFSFWFFIYLGLTSSRDKKHIAQQLTEQRLTNLMNQINPHFLFNSLNTIRGMIFEDQEKAADLVTQLSSLFRYNLASDSKGVTSLAKELEVCQQYLAIEHIRLGNRLQVDLRVLPATMMMEIPTMSLLTLVENAIKHGIANLKAGGTVVIKSELKKDKVIITVINPYQADLVVSGTQVGLNNIKQRISLMYGAQGTLAQEENNGIYQVQLTLPCEVLSHE
jgi:hypothetical protein